MRTQLKLRLTLHNKFGPLASLLDQAAISGGNFALLMLIGRTANRSQVGLYAVAISTVPIFVSLLDSLIAGPYVIHCSSTTQNKRSYRGAALCHTLILGGLLASLGLLVSLLVNRLSVSFTLLPALVALSLVVTPILLRELARRLAVAEHSPTLSFLVSSIAVATQLACASALAKKGHLTVFSAMFSVGLGSLFAGALYFTRYAHTWFLSRSGVVDAWKENVRSGKWIVVSQGVLMLYFAFPQWFVSLKSNTSSSATLAAALSIVMIANTALTGIGNFLLPQASSTLRQSGGDAAFKLLFRTSFFCATVALLVTSAVGLWGTNAIRVIYAGRFEVSRHLLCVLAASLIVRSMALGSQLGCWIFLRPQINVVTNCIAFAILLSLSFQLFNTSGLLGIAYAIFISEAVSAAVRWYLLRALATSSIKQQYSMAAC